MIQFDVFTNYNNKFANKFAMQIAPKFLTICIEYYYWCFKTCKSQSFIKFDNPLP